MSKYRRLIAIALLASLALILAAFASGCASGPTAQTPKQQAAVLNDSFAISETVLTGAVQSGIISPATNAQKIRPAVLAARKALDALTEAVSKTPPDPTWKVALDAVTKTLPEVLKYAKDVQAGTPVSP